MPLPIRACAPILAFAAACSSAASPSTPAQPDPVRLDLETLCGPEAQAKATSLPELGPYLEGKVRSDEVKQALADLKATGGGDVFRTRIQELMASRKLEQCATLDKLFAPAP